MIFEDFNRPITMRFIEKFLFKIGKAKTLGIMQVKTNKIIDDKKSIVIAIEKLINDLKELKSKSTYGSNPAYKDVDEHNLIVYLISKYNSGDSYNSDVMNIMYQLEKISDYKKLEYLTESNV